MKSLTIKIISYIFFFAAGAFLGFLVRADIDAPDTAAVYEAPDAAVPSATPAPAPMPTQYVISAERGRLCLFRVTADETALIKSADFSENLFPLYDRTLLKTGIHADSREEAMLIWENYTD